MTDTPIDLLTLRQAAELYGLKVATLRAEAARGRLAVFRMGKSDYTSHAAMQLMVKRCQDADPRHACISTGPGAPGASETERMSSARAALRQTIEGLKKGSPNTSARSTDQSLPRVR
jgi:hypothetical protein